MPVCGVHLAACILSWYKANANRSVLPTVLNIVLADAFIEIPASAMYAIAYPVQVWAAGKSGWFEINPAPVYQPMYQTVCEGIELYYLIQFAYEEAQEAEEASRSKKVSWPNQKIERLFLAVCAIYNPPPHNCRVSPVQQCINVCDSTRLS